MSTFAPAVLAPVDPSALDRMRSFAHRDLLHGDAQEDGRGFHDQVMSLDGHPEAMQALFAAMEPALIADLWRGLHASALSGAGRHHLDDERAVVAALANNLDGATAGHVAEKLSPEALMVWSQAMAGQPVDKRLDFVRVLAPWSTERPSHALSGEGRFVRAGDPRADAIGTVLASLAHDPKAFSQAVSALDDDQLNAAVLSRARLDVPAGLTGSGNEAPRVEITALCRMLDAARYVADARTQTRLFSAGLEVLKVTGMPDARRVFGRALGDLLDSNPLAMVGEFIAHQQVYGPGAPLIDYLVEQLRDDPTDHVGDRHLEHLFLMAGGLVACLSATEPGKSKRYFPGAMAAGVLRGSWEAAIRRAGVERKAALGLTASVITSASLAINFSSGHPVVTSVVANTLRHPDDAARFLPWARGGIVAAGGIWRHLLISERVRVDNLDREMRSAGLALATVKPKTLPIAYLPGGSRFVQEAQQVVTLSR